MTLRRCSLAPSLAAPLRHGLVATALAVLVGCAPAVAGGPGARRAPRVADFALRDIDGRTVRLSDFVGRNVVLVNFWATWCTPCASELPHLQRLYETYRERGFVVLGVSMDGPESVAAVVPLARRYGLSFPVLLDEETSVTGRMNPKRAAPFSLLIGRDGAVVATHEGYMAGDELRLEEEIRRLLDQQGG